MAQSLSLLELFEMFERILGIKMDYTMLPPRQSDHKVFVSDITKIKNKISWEPKVSVHEGVTKVVDLVKTIK